MEKTTQGRSSVFILLSKYYQGNNKVAEIGGACGTHEGEENAKRILVEKFEGKKPPRTPWRGYEGDI
jgi:hypothetical protein